MFDPEEVDEVAEQITRTGRALDGEELPFLSERYSASRRPHTAHQSENNGHLRRALSEVAHLKRLLDHTKADQEEWSSRIAEAVDAVVVAVGRSADEDVLDALEGLVGTLRHE
jgi:hypothetical protein